MKSRAEIQNEIASVANRLAGVETGDIANAPEPAEPPRRRKGSDLRTARPATDERDTGPLQYRDGPGPEQEPDPDPGEKDPDTDENAPEDAPESGEAGGEGEEGSLEYLNDLPEVLGIDPEEFYSLKLKLQGGDGPEKTFGEWKEDIQNLTSTKGEIEAERQSLAAQRAEFEKVVAERAAAVQQLTERQQKAQGMVSGIERQWEAMEQSWAARRDKNPGQVALEQQELRAAYENAHAEVGAARQEAQALSAQAQQTHIQQQHQILTAGDAAHEALTPIEGWSTQEGRRAAQAKIRKTATSLGVTDSELGAVSDARMLKALELAGKWLDHEKRVQESTKKLKGVPRGKLPKGTRRGTGEKARKSELDETIGRAKRRGASGQDKRDAMAALGRKHGLIPDR